MEEDCNDIWKEVYPELLVIEKIMGKKGLKGGRGQNNFSVDELKFYPLDESLSPIIKLKLRCKELNYLLYKLQESLEIKMSNEGSLPRKEKIKIMNNKKKEEDRNYKKLLEREGFIKTASGQIIKKQF